MVLNVGPKAVKSWLSTELPDIKPLATVRWENQPRRCIVFERAELSIIQMASKGTIKDSFFFYFNECTEAQECMLSSKVTNLAALG